MSLEEFEKDLRLLKNNEGVFQIPDDESGHSFGFFNQDYMAEFMSGIIFFSGTHESVKQFSAVLGEFGIEHHEIMPLPFSKSELTKHKIGRNELCHCGSGRKYKKCCLTTDC